MVAFRISHLFPLFLLCKAIVLPQDDSPFRIQSGPNTVVDESIEYDAVIIGGGPAGLSALSGLARVRRNVLLIDSGEYRNGPTRNMHDVIGSDGLDPAYFRYQARRLISYYKTVSMVNGTVTEINKQEDGSFEIRAKNVKHAVSSRRGRQVEVRAKKIILATGIRDVMPHIPGFEENFGEGIFWCPWCDGYEHKDQKLGIIGNLKEIAGLSQEMSTLNKDVVAFTLDGPITDETRQEAKDVFRQWEEYVDMKKIKILDVGIEKIERGPKGDPDCKPDNNPSLPSQRLCDMFHIHLTDGQMIKREAIFASLENRQRSKVAGVALNITANRIVVDETKGLETNVSGIYAVGDANSVPSTNVPHAMYSGKKAAVSLHIKLAREETRRQLQQSGRKSMELKRSLPEDEMAAVWKRMNDDAGDLMYAGEYYR